MPVAMPAVPADVRTAAVTVHGETTFSVTMTTSIGGMVSISAVDPWSPGPACRRSIATSPGPGRHFRRTPSNAPAARPSALTDGRLSRHQPRRTGRHRPARAGAERHRPARSGGAQLDVLDLTYDAPTDRLLVATRSPQVGTGARASPGAPALTVACRGRRDGARSGRHRPGPPPITIWPGRSAPRAVPCHELGQWSGRPTVRHPERLRRRRVIKIAGDGLVRPASGGRRLRLAHSDPSRWRGISPASWPGPARSGPATGAGGVVSADALPATRTPTQVPVPRAGCGRGAVTIRNGAARRDSSAGTKPARDSAERPSGSDRPRPDMWAWRPASSSAPP